MTKRKTRNKSSYQSTSSAQWPWLIMGILCGLIAAGLVYLHFMEREQSSLQKSNRKQQLTNEPHFEFYNILSEMGGETQASSSEKTVTPAKTELSPPAISSEKEKRESSKQYIIQAGSFGRSQEADQLKAQLILSGFDVTVKEFTSNGKTYYRVLLGPYVDNTSAKDVQKQLAAQNIKSLVVTAK